VTAHGTAVGQIAYTPIDSGYSLDNLVPGTPGGIVLWVNGNNISLRWEKSADSDFRYFAIYRSTVSGFNPIGTAPCATTVDAFYVDIGAASAQTYYYRISAIDFSGNESPLSVQVSSSTLAVDPGSDIPGSFSLLQNYPNPFNPSTIIGYELPVASRVILVLYNGLGQEVARLVDGTQQAGRYEVQWNAGGFPSGVYFCRIHAGSFVDTRKLLLLR
jgi:hypothetical protein